MTIHNSDVIADDEWLAMTNNAFLCTGGDEKMLEKACSLVWQSKEQQYDAGCMISSSMMMADEEWLFLPIR